MTAKLTELEIEKLLVRKGFSLVAQQPGSHKALEHKPTGATVVLSWAYLNDYRPEVVVAVRKLLDEKGIADHAEFDALAEDVKARHARVT
jgi:predicted RNA binding protein YcfA (HicA-like mRNA interferase family)